MIGVASLFSLCMKAIETTILQGCCHLEDVFELPPDLFDGLLMNLQPLALHDLNELSDKFCCGRGSIQMGSNDGRKRIRYGDFDAAWMELFRKRWPDIYKKVKMINNMRKWEEEICKLVKQDDWQQLYWEKHLQCCLDEAAEKAMLPAFDGIVGAIVMPDTIMRCIGNNLTAGDDRSKLLYHCNNFGRYARCLRLQSVLCVPETCELLRESNLQSLVFQRILSNTHVDGVCMLLDQNKETLHSVELIHCRLAPATVDQICSSHYKAESETHKIHHFAVKSSRIFENDQSSFPTGLISFMSRGRSLKSLQFCETGMGPNTAKVIVDTLLGAPYGLLGLEISDNNIAGWLSKINGSAGSFVTQSSMMMKSLNVLNLRGNNMCQTDAQDLAQMLVHMPNLRSLDISENPIEDDGLRSLIPCLVMAFGKAIPLEDIMIDNCGLSGMAVTELLRSLSSLKEPLHTLSMADNNLGSSVSSALAKFLKISGVKILNIEDIGLGPTGFQELEEEVSKNTSFVRINMSKNRGGIKAAYFLSRVIREAPHLVSVNAGYNFMPSDSLEVIYDALKQAKGQLQLLDLTGNLPLAKADQLSKLSGFCHHGSPVVVVHPHATSTMLYDDDP